MTLFIGNAYMWYGNSDNYSQYHVAISETGNPSYQTSTSTYDANTGKETYSSWTTTTSSTSKDTYLGKTWYVRYGGNNNIYDYHGGSIFLMDRRSQGTLPTRQELVEWTLNQYFGL